MACIPSIYPQQQQCGSPQQQQSPTIDDLILSDQETYPNTPVAAIGHTKKQQQCNTKHQPSQLDADSPKVTPRASSRRNSKTKNNSRKPQPIEISDSNNICGAISSSGTTTSVVVPSLPVAFVAPAVGLTSPKVVEGCTPKSQRRFRESFLPQPTRGFTVTHTNKGLYTMSVASPTSNEQVKCWESVATPRPDLNRPTQVSIIKAEVMAQKQKRVAAMLEQLELDRQQHLVHLTCLVNEAGTFQRNVLANDNKHPRYAVPTSKLEQQGLPKEHPQRKATFMLTTQPKMWAFLLADIATLLSPLDKLAPEEEPATPKFVADQIYSLNLFQQSNFQAAIADAEQQQQ